MEMGFQRKKGGGKEEKNKIREEWKSGARLLHLRDLREGMMEEEDGDLFSAASALQPRLLYPSSKSLLLSNERRENSLERHIG